MARRFRHVELVVIGLTGGIGAGKSDVARLLGGRGFFVIDADRVGHDVLRSPDVCDRIVERFGAGVLSGTGKTPGSSPQIDRRALGSIVFADPVARHDLEAIVHPRMRARFLAEIERERQSGDGHGHRHFVVLDAAILLEAGWDDLCDLILFVEAPREPRIERVMSQRGWSRASFDARERAQWPVEQKRRRADLIINNDAGVDSLVREVDRVAAHLAELSCPVIEITN